MSLNNQEVDSINENKFLAELGRLLTFMYEEDRQTALAMYSRMFEETGDEQGLLQLLVSPTRQAVVLARSYDAKDRKLQIQTQGEDVYSDPDNIPAFVFAIDKIAKQAEALGTKLPPVSDDQFSIFDQPAEAASVPVAAEAETPPAAEAEAARAETENAAVQAEGDGSIDETADALDAFLKDFSVENGELVSSKAPETDEARSEAEAESSEESGDEAPTPAESTEAEQAAPAEVPAETAAVKEPNILLLILYIFLAIPVGIMGISLLLIPAVLCLSLAACFASFGISLIGVCFGSFAVIADTLVVFGVAIALLALGLLFIWSFVWFLGGAIVGFVKGLCRLGAKLCFREVAQK